MSVPLSEQAQELLDAKTFATVATVGPDGDPQSSLVWVRRDGDDILFSTLQSRQKYLNLVRDPRVSLLLSSVDQPYTYVEVRGVAEMTTEGGRELIDELSNKYLGKGYRIEPPEAVRVVVRVHPRKLTGWP
ncbi:PPOX class F420-dependent oxidoreductase [Kitasatospora azatica]|uniref:PPOX class F420-dependent oxidoreductase n=1 Tax=Kitasatospora azatica TaxID=58347 RepID=UPI00056542F4|nr:PPOX class F420-dependent oxidoreductase [Kitasatospora azatica]